MNLITEKWIPVLRSSGADFIAPFELTDKITSDPILKLNASRPDFNGALMQFLIGLLQTALPDLEKAQWRRWNVQPPSGLELQKIFAPLEPHFNLFGDGPCFMQDLNLQEQEGESKPIAALLIEQPGQQTLEQNADHFIKRDQIQQLCFACAAAALFTLQTNAPSGGAGHRTSMRGGGPLTTLVISDRQEKQILWKMLWLNVLTKREFEGYSELNFSDGNLDKIFPWCEATITSENDKEINASDVHLLQMYWGMPRRIRLLANNDTQKICSLCGRVSSNTISEYITKNYGANYSENWLHVLSPYRKNKDNKRFPMHPQPGGIGYQHWLALTLEDSAGVVKANQARLRSKDESSPNEEIKIWAFGYDMDNMKARCWYESYMPFYDIPNENINELQIILAQFIKTTEQARFYLNKALNTCRVPSVVARQQIWYKTQSKFYEVLKKIIDTFSQADKEKEDQIKLEWLSYVQSEAYDIFSTLANVQHAEINMIEKYIKAENELKRCLYSKKMFNDLGLIKKEKNS